MESGSTGRRKVSVIAITFLLSAHLASKREKWGFNLLIFTCAIDILLAYMWESVGPCNCHSCCSCSCGAFRQWRRLNCVAMGIDETVSGDCRCCRCAVGRECAHTLTRARCVSARRPACLTCCREALDLQAGFHLLVAWACAPRTCASARAATSSTEWVR